MSEEKQPTKTRARYATQEAYERAMEAKRRYRRKWGAKMARKTKPAREARRKRLEEKRAIAKKREAEFMGSVVKLHIGLGMSQEAIFDLLAGLVTRSEISDWCKRAKGKAAKLAEKKAS